MGSAVNGLRIRQRGGGLSAEAARGARHRPTRLRPAAAILPTGVTIEVRGSQPDPSAAARPTRQRSRESRRVDLLAIRTSSQTSSRMLRPGVVRGGWGHRLGCGPEPGGPFDVRQLRRGRAFTLGTHIRFRSWRTIEQHVQHVAGVRPGHRRIRQVVGSETRLPRGSFRPSSGEALVLVSTRILSGFPAPILAAAAQAQPPDCARQADCGGLPGQARRRRLLLRRANDGEDANESAIE